MSGVEAKKTRERSRFFTPGVIAVCIVGGVLVALVITWLALNASARRLEEERASAKAELDRLRSRTVPAVAAALIDVESPAAGAARALLTHSVTNAAWYPAYVAHAAQDVYSLAHTA